MDRFHVEKRTTSMNAKQLRRSGIIPCSVHGGQLEESLSLQMAKKDAETLFRTKHVGSTLALELEGKQIPVLVKEKNKDVLSGEMQHMVFEALKADVAVNSVAHIVLKNADLVPGQLEQLLFEVPFSSLPGDMIDTVTIDLEGKGVGTDIALTDIPEFRSDAITLKVDPDSLVVRILEKKAVADDAEETAED